MASFNNIAANDEQIGTQRPTARIISIIPAFVSVAANDETPVDVQKIKPQATQSDTPDTDAETPTEQKKGLFRGMLSSYSEKRETKADQKNRIAFAAYLNADSTSEEDLRKWVKKNFSRGSIAEYKGDQSLNITEKDVLKHLDGGLLSGLSKKQHKALAEKREEHIKDEANKFFEKHGSETALATPKKLGRVSYLSSNWKEQPIKSLFGAAANIGVAAINTMPATVDLIRTRNHSKNEIKNEQADRLLTIAFRDADNISKSGIRSWLEKNEKNGNLALFQGDHKELKASVDDVMKHFRGISRDHKDALIDASINYDKRNVAKITNDAYESFDMG